MKKVYDYWFPDHEEHLVGILDKCYKESNIAEYQYIARAESLKYLTNFRVAIDIGANIGLWAKDLCKEFDSVIAFEPIDEFCECLKINVTAKNLHIEQVGLGNTETSANFVIPEYNMGHTHIDPASLGNGNITIKTLDSFNYPIVDYIKIDCEGFEYRVLQGSKETILRCKPVVVIEQKPHDFYKSEYGQFDGIKLLESWGMICLGKVKKDYIMGWANT
jgi:FkbM family methyltransferase